MDIQKEHAEFESILVANPDFDEHLLLKDEDGSYKDQGINDCFSFFQLGIELIETKAQTIPEGFVLVPKECSDDMAEIIAITAKVCGGIAGDVYDAVVKQAMIEAAGMEG